MLNIDGIEEELMKAIKEIRTLKIRIKRLEEMTCGYSMEEDYDE